MRRYAFEALEKYDWNNNYLLALIRDIGGRYSANACYFRLLVHCRVPEASPRFEAGKELHFFVSYDVVADSPEEALEILREYEETDIRPALEIEECDPLEERPEDPKGVYWRTRHHYYDALEEEEEEKE